MRFLPDFILQTSNFSLIFEGGEKNFMNSKIAMSGLSILASLAVMGGATFAFFSSAATSTANTFAAGSLVLQVDDVDDTTPAATVDASITGAGMAPGSSTTGFISLHNGGSIDIEKIKLAIIRAALDMSP